MAVATFTKFNSFVAAVANKVHNLGADTIKVMLSNTAPVATNAIKTDITDLAIGVGAGYTAGGAPATLVSSAQTGGLYTLKLNNVTFTASGTVGPFRYVVLYNSSATNGELIAFWDNGVAVTMGATDTFVVQFDATNGVLTLQ